MNSKQKLQYIWDYYKLHLFLFLLILCMVGCLIYGKLMHKEIVLYAALVNISASEAFVESLDDGFLEHLNKSASKNEVRIYKNLSLTDDVSSPYYEYTYASSMKLLAAIDTEQLDVILMDREVFDAFAQEEYLAYLDDLLLQKAPDLYEKLKPSLIAGTDLDSHCMGIDLSQSPIVQKAGFTDTVYLGIIANSPRTDMAVSYISYLF